MGVALREVVVSLPLEKAPLLLLLINQLGFFDSVIRAKAGGFPSPTPLYFGSFLVVGLASSSSSSNVIEMAFFR